jgi:8-oxo-dGTP diphosphatase/2-hydroxy-dATP diphosphatase
MGIIYVKYIMPMARSGHNARPPDLHRVKIRSICCSVHCAMPPKLLSLVLVINHARRRVLLGLKRRGFGAGNYNGFGGKLEEGENMFECARRELQEESGLLVPVSALEQCGFIRFFMKSDGMKNPQGGVSKQLHVHIFVVDAEKALRLPEASATASGECFQTPVETEEMTPRWFSFDDIPFDSMWKDDPLWFPLMLSGKRFEGDVVFADKNVIESHDIKVLPSGTEFSSTGHRAH